MASNVDFTGKHGQRVLASVTIASERIEWLAVVDSNSSQSFSRRYEAAPLGRDALAADQRQAFDRILHEIDRRGTSEIHGDEHAEDGGAPTRS